MLILDVSDLKRAASRGETEIKIKYLSTQSPTRKGLGEVKNPFQGEAVQPEMET